MSSTPTKADKEPELKAGGDNMVNPEKVIYIPHSMEGYSLLHKTCGELLERLRLAEEAFCKIQELCATFDNRPEKMTRATIIAVIQEARGNEK